MSNLKYVRCVGPKRAEVLEREADIVDVNTLFDYYPLRYVDRSKVYSISSLTSEMPYIQIYGHFLNKEIRGEGSKRRLVARFSDETGFIDVVWFNNFDYILGRINTFDHFLLFGRPSYFNGLAQLPHPEIERNPDMQKIVGQPLMPVYSITEGMRRAGISNKVLQNMIAGTFEFVTMAGIRETLPYNILVRHNLMPRPQALWNVHFPSDLKQLELARFRLKFEELFYVQISLLSRRTQNRQAVSGLRFTRVGPHLNEFYRSHLRFEPTGAQKRVVHEIWDDLRSGFQMNRLVQGDVGSGKTLVALLSMLIATGNGHQACLMAPTEILATQHYNSLVEMLEGMPLRVALLRGSIKVKAKKEVLEGLADGSINIVVGTHALIEPNVVFKDLALCVIDEQHRFGVEQRARLWGKNTPPPHVLVMTATPIPRTLAMTVYGDLDISVIDEMPPGRKPVVTEHYFHNTRNRLNAFLRTELQKGRQVYVVYPLIKENERMAYKDLLQGFEYMKQCFPEYEVCMVHGQQRPEEKETAMQRFVSGQARIMVATTVIEVGVNVPNASVMVIESAERFGLSQLHQLRGRVGRGADQSYCILMTAVELSRDTRRRIETMCATSNGFEIAEADMRLRGPGDIEGTAQSGLPFRLRIADLSRDAQLVTFSRDVANEVMASDPQLTSPESAIIKVRLRSLEVGDVNWSMIS